MMIPGHRRSGSSGNTVVTTTTSASVSTIITAPESLEDDSRLFPNHNVIGTARCVSWTHGIRPQVSSDSTEEPNVDKQTLLDPQLMPLPPCTLCPESVEIYEKHCMLVDDFMRLQAEILQLEHRKQ